MTENKQDFISISQQKQISLLECCMCGDSGLTHELFRCKICHFRSQHRYCSNLYPRAEFYDFCNWCLNQKEADSKSPNSSNSSATCKNAITGEDDIKKKKKKKKQLENDDDDDHNYQRRNKDLKLEMTKKYSVIIKSSSPEKSPRKRIINNARLEEKLRRTKSEEISKSNSTGFITRPHVIRNKVRRYKLLDEVSS